MNIFEQYGIREVADVTLYGITTNKYGEKIYIPVLHFDTLKVSGLEQTSEQTTARGGLGNTEHVLWNHGKTVTFNLEDAVYTPASQSLMWGGLYGLSKIKVKGRWNPYLYNNQNGYSLKRVKKEEESQMLKDFGVNDINELKKGKDYVEVYLPCEEAEGYVYIKSEVEGLKYTLESEEPIQVKKNDIPMRIQYSDEEDLEENKKDLYIYDSQWFANIGKNNLESVELQVNNYGDFQNKMIFEKNQRTLNQEVASEIYSYIFDNACDYYKNTPHSQYSSLTENFFDISIGGDMYKAFNRLIQPYESDYMIWNNIKNNIQPGQTELNYNYSKVYIDISQNSVVCWLDLSIFLKDFSFIQKKEENFDKYSDIYLITDDDMLQNIEFTLNFSFNAEGVTQDPNKPRIPFYNWLKEEIISLEKKLEDHTFKEWIELWIDYRCTNNIEWRKDLYIGYGYGDHYKEGTIDNYIKKTNIEWRFKNPSIQKEPIHEYQWKNCNISLVSPKNNYTNIAVEDNINLCYHTLDNNTNKRIFFYDQSNELPWHSKETFYTTVSCRITDINGDEQILSQKIPLGDFYIVEDENLSTPTLSNFINPINSGIENRKILEHFENLTASQRFAIDVDKNIKSYNLSQLPEYDRTNLTVYYNPKTMLPYEANNYSFTKANGTQLKEGNYAVIEKGDQYYKWSRTIADKGTALGQTVNITKNNFPFNFKLVGETYIRDRYQEDSHYQIELYNCAILDSININLSASGEPNIVNIKMKALTDQCGDIGRLTIYNQKSCNKVRSAAQQKQQQTYIPIDILEKIPELIAESDYEIRILHPINNTIYCLEKDCAIPDKGEFSYLKLYVPNKDDTSWKGKTYYEYYDYIKDTLNKEDLLIVKIDNNDIIQGFVTKDDIDYDFSRDEEAAP